MSNDFPKFDFNEYEIAEATKIKSLESKVNDLEKRLLNAERAIKLGVIPISTTIDSIEVIDSHCVYCHVGRNAVTLIPERKGD